MRLRELLGTELPLIQAPMAGVQDAALAVAVSNAGGLGSLPCAMLTADGVRSELEVMHKASSGPFNLNFFCHTPPTPDPERESRWRAALAPYYAEYGLDPLAISAAPQRSPFNAEFAELIEAHRPRVVSFHFGLPAPELLARVKRAGAKVLSSATTLDEARWLEARGVDAIIAQGAEAGGHRGMFLSRDVATQVGTLELLSALCRSVALPVIAAGGIADAAGVRQAMERGAAGVQIGTAYLLCPETKTSAVHRAALAGGTKRETALTNLFTGRPARAIVNRLVRERGPMSQAAPEFPLAISALAPLRQKAEAQGRSDFSPLWAGQNNGSCRETSAAELTRELANGFS